MNGYEYIDTKLKDVTHFNISWAWSAGAISSNLKDSARFIKYGIRKHTLLDINATKQQRTWGFLAESPYFGSSIYYGFHLLKIENFIGHSGNVTGYDSFILYECSTDTTLIIVVNNSVDQQGILPAEFIGSYIINRLNNKIDLSDAEQFLTSDHPKSKCYYS